MKTAFITGISGQDGTYLSEFLLGKNYKVHGLIQRCEVDNTQRLKPFINNSNLELHYGDLSDDACLYRIINQIKPDEIYNLAAQSHVGVSFETPIHTANINAVAVTRLLEIIKTLDKSIRFYQASSSEIFGNSQTPQHEMTQMAPCSPYAIAKLHAYHSVKLYRETYGLFAVNGVLFNHESPLRGEDFVTKKVTKAVAEISKGNQSFLELGNLEAKRDWRHARDFVKGMWLMMQKDIPDDYVLATGHTHSVRELVELAFGVIGKRLIWEGQNENEVARDQQSKQILVRVDKKLFRPNELHVLCGNAAKAKEELDWKPETSFEELVREMVFYDCETNKEETDLKNVA